MEHSDEKSSSKDSATSTDSLKTSPVKKAHQETAVQGTAPQGAAPDKAADPNEIRLTAPPPTTGAVAGQPPSGNQAVPDKPPLTGPPVQVQVTPPSSPRSTNCIMNDLFLSPSEGHLGYLPDDIKPGSQQPHRIPSLNPSDVQSYSTLPLTSAWSSEVYSSAISQRSMISGYEPLYDPLLESPISKLDQKQMQQARVLREQEAQMAAMQQQINQIRVKLHGPTDPAVALLVQRVKLVIHKSAQLMHQVDAAIQAAQAHN